MEGDLGLDPFQAAARGGAHAVAVGERAVRVHDQAEGAEILRLQLGGALEERDALAVAALRPQVAGGEEVGLEQVRTQPQRLLQRHVGFAVASGRIERQSLGRMRLRQRGLQRQGLLAVGQNVAEGHVGIAHAHQVAVAVGDAGIGARILGIDVRRAHEHLPRHAQGAIAPTAAQEEGTPHQVVLVGLGVGGRAAGDEGALLRQQLHLEGVDDAAGDLVLEREDIVQAAVVAIGPEMPAAAAVDQLDGDAHAVPGLAYAALEDVADTERVRRLAHFDGLALVGEDRAARDDEQRGHARQVGDDVLGEAVGEILLLGIAADVGERQHGDGGAPGGGVRSRQCAGPLGHRRRDARLKLHGEGAEIGMIAHRIKRNVLAHPLGEGAPVDGRCGERRPQAVEGVVGPAERDIGAGDVVVHDGIVGINAGRPRRPLLGALAFAEVGQDIGSECQGMAIIGLRCDLDLNPLQALPRRRQAVVHAPERAVFVGQEAQGAKVVLIERGGPLVQLRRLLVVALGAAVAGVEIVGLEQLRPQLDGLFEGRVRGAVLPRRVECQPLGGTGFGCVRRQLQGAPAVGGDDVERYAGHAQQLPVAVAIGKAGIGASAARVDLDRLREQLSGNVERALAPDVPQEEGAPHEVVLVGIGATAAAGRRRRAGSAGRWSTRRNGALGLDLPVQPLGLRLRLDAELGGQRFPAQPILLERQAVTSLGRMELHERAVHVLAQGIVGQDGLGGRRRRRQRARLHLPRQQPVEDAQHEQAQPLALVQQPLLAGRIAHRQAVEKRPLVEAPWRLPDRRSHRSELIPRNGERRRPPRRQRATAARRRSRSAQGSTPHSVFRRTVSSWRRLPRAWVSPRSLQRMPMIFSRVCASPARSARKASSSCALRPSGASGSPVPKRAPKPPSRSSSSDAIASALLTLAVARTGILACLRPRREWASVAAVKERLIRFHEETCSRHGASFDKLRMRNARNGRKIGPHPEPVEGRTAPIQASLIPPETRTRSPRYRYRSGRHARPGRGCGTSRRDHSASPTRPSR